MSDPATRVDLDAILADIEVRLRAIRARQTEDANGRFRTAWPDGRQAHEDRGFLIDHVARLNKTHASELTALRAEVERMREALEPFAAAADMVPLMLGAKVKLSNENGTFVWKMDADRLRKAKSALSPGGAV